MYMHVPTFHDSRCHRKGMSERTNPIAENTVNAVLVALISWRAIFPETAQRKGCKVFQQVWCAYQEPVDRAREIENGSRAVKCVGGL